MSLENQVTRVSQGMKDTLKTLINKLGGNVTDELIDQYPELAASLDPITPASIGASPVGHTHNYAGSSSAGGSATSAVKLSTARTIRTNLGSTGTASFDGTSNVTPGVTGTLPVANGGTGATTAAAARTKIGAVSIDDVNKAISDAIGTVIGGSY